MTLSLTTIPTSNFGLSAIGASSAVLGAVMMLWPLFFQCHGLIDDNEPGRVGVAQNNRGNCDGQGRRSARDNREQSFGDPRASDKKIQRDQSRNFRSGAEAQA